MRRLLVLFLWLVFGEKTACATPGTYAFRWDADCSAAYQAFLALRLDAGTAAVRRAIVRDPYNLVPTFLADYDDCLVLMLNGDRRDYEQRRGHYDERLELLDNGPAGDPWQRLTRGVVHLHWALISVRFGERVKAALAFRRSYLALKELKKRSPEFPYTGIFLGFEESIVGTVPDDYRWIAGMFGLRGSTVRGVGQIGTFLKEHPAADEPFRAEAVLYHTYLRFYLLQQQDAAWRFVNSTAFPVDNQLLHALVRANLALNYRRADAALASLRAAQALPESRRFPVVDYELGNALLHKLDAGCIAAYERYLAASRGRWYEKDAQQKLAWAYLLTGRREKAQACLRAVLKTGSAFVDADRQAQRLAEAGQLPNPQLLALRLLCDGGYYAQALEKLNALRETGLSPSDRLEYNFRLGRTWDGLGNAAKALAYYQSTYDAGRDRPEHFAARAALQAGLLQERAGQPAAALNWYNAALALRHHDFQASIDQQAKAGIDRLGR